MTKQEKKLLREIINKIEDAQAEVSIMIAQEQDRLDKIENSISQTDRAIKLESNIDNLENAENSLDEAIISLGNILT